jgi:cellulose synthase operon protein C
VINPSGPARFTTLPEARPEENRLEASLDLALAPDGSAAVQGSWRISGMEAPAYRRSYGVENGRSALLEQSMSRLFPGAQVRSVQTSDLARIEDDVQIGFTFAAPRSAQRDGAGLRFSPFGPSPGYMEAYASLSTRRQPLDPGGPRDARFRYRYALPPGWRVVELPEAAAAAGPLGSFAVRYREEEGTVVAEGHVLVPAGRISPGDYPAFRDLMASADRAFARRIRVAPAATAERGEPK